jgi:hypothetical protein
MKGYKEHRPNKEPLNKRFFCFIKRKLNKELINMSPNPNNKEIKRLKQEDAYYDAENKKDRQKNKKQTKEQEVDKRKNKDRRP